MRLTRKKATIKLFMSNSPLNTTETVSMALGCPEKLETNQLKPSLANSVTEKSFLGARKPAKDSAGKRRL